MRLQAAVPSWSERADPGPVAIAPSLGCWSRWRKELLDDTAVFPGVTRVNATARDLPWLAPQVCERCRSLVFWQYVDISMQIGFSHSEERECLPTTVMVNASQYGNGEAIACPSP
jgi:hypothetical protein